MSLITSSQFASSCHGGTDWRDASKKILEDLQKAQTENSKFNLGFLYLSDHLAKDAGSILNLFRSVLNIEHWAGCIGIGVCGADKIRVDQPAMAAMIGEFEDRQFHLFSRDLRSENTQAWLEQVHPMLVLAHAHPQNDFDIFEELQTLESVTEGGFAVGGVSLCRPHLLPEKQDVDDVHFQGGLDGVLFADDVHVASSLSQGCVPIGKSHIITRCEDHLIYELETGHPQDVFEEDLRKMALQKIGEDPDRVEAPGGVVPHEFKDVFTGEVLAAFPVQESDMGDILVRNIMGINDDGSMLVAHESQPGSRMLFVHRDDQTVRQDLSAKLVELRHRVEADTGTFRPKAGIYISCAARAFDENGKPNEGEIELIREILGEFPLCGFYAGGEIKGTQLYGYTGILTLFL